MFFWLEYENDIMVLIHVEKFVWQSKIMDDRDIKIDKKMSDCCIAWFNIIMRKIVTHLIQLMNGH